MKMRFVRSTLAGAAIHLVACSAGRYDVRVQVEPPSDGACLGVVGFEVQVPAASPTLSLRPGPVLEPSRCRIDPPLEFRDLDIDALLSVTVTGYDSKHTAILSGTIDVGTLRAPNGVLSLKLVPEAPGRPILVLDRGKLLEAVPLSEIVRMEITTQGSGKSGLLAVNVDDTNRAFFAVEPGAFALDTWTPEQDQRVTVAFTTKSQGTVGPLKMKVGLTEAGYWSAVP